MLTVSNKLATSLVIPEGLGDKGALVLSPKTEAKVEKVTASLKDAEKRGLVGIAYPPTRKKNKAKVETNTETKADPQETA